MSNILHLPDFAKESLPDSAWIDNRRALGSPVALLRNGRQDGYIWARSRCVPCRYDVRLLKGEIVPNCMEEELHDREGQALKVES